MKKLFISQPMKGKSEEEILLERQKAIREAEKKVDEPVKVIDSYFQCAPADVAGAAVCKAGWGDHTGERYVEVPAWDWIKTLDFSWRRSG